MSHFRCYSDVATQTSSLDFHPEVPQKLFDHSPAILEADTTDFSSPMPALFSCPSPVPCREGLVSSPSIHQIESIHEVESILQGDSIQEVDYIQQVEPIYQVHSEQVDSPHSNHSSIHYPQPIEIHNARSIPPSPELPSRQSSTFDLKVDFSPSRVVMQSPVSSVPASPSGPELTPISANRIRHNSYYLEDGVVFLVRFNNRSKVLQECSF